MKPNKIWYLVIIVGLLSILLFLRYIVPIDNCLDEGGAWDYERDVCFYSPKLSS